MIVLGKAAIPAATGAAGSIVAATTENTTVAVGTTLAVIIGFAGLLIQQVVRNQKAVWAIVAAKDAEILALREDLSRVRWEREVARFHAGERPDPGPYQPRTSHA